MEKKLGNFAVDGLITQRGRTEIYTGLGSNSRVPERKKWDLEVAGTFWSDIFIFLFKMEIFSGDET